MGLYIKGMGMPKNCGECHFCHTENFESWCCPTEREDILFDAMPEWCPLIEVPEPHGDLVDHSEIGKILIKALDECEISEEDKGHVLRMVWIAPTVIEGTE